MHGLLFFLVKAVPPHIELLDGIIVRQHLDHILAVTPPHRVAGDVNLNGSHDFVFKMTLFSCLGDVNPFGSGALALTDRK
jgi:hypothetical protein